MLFNSFHFILFFPIVTLVYFLIPHRIRHLWLLGASYYFYMCWNAQYALLMTTSILITYLSGILIDRSRQLKTKKLWVALSFISNLAILFFFKYFNFLSESINGLVVAMHMSFRLPALDILLPVGISFYTFQALSYTMDVYRGEIYAEKNILKYALFVSFFPQLVAGPIERSKNLLIQINERHSFDYDRAKEGFVLVLGGFIKKIVIADRLAMFVNGVYNNCQDYGSLMFIIATVFFAFQIYCDFSGYSDIAVGCARIMGFNLMQNFNRPYCAKSIAEFWRRWHISLSTWFRDYLYIPLGGSRVSFARWGFNTMVVFLTSGLWHGANWTFVIWGALHGVYQIVGRKTRGWRDNVMKRLHLPKESFVYRLGAVCATFVLVSIAWVFFRANTLSDAMYILKCIFTGHNFSFVYDDALMGHWNDFVLGAALIPALLAAEAFLDRKGGNAWIQRRALPIRWAIYLAALFGIILFGIYGNVTEASFIYFQF